MSKLLRGLLRQDGPQANLLAGLLLILTTCGITITHAIHDISEIISIISILGGMGCTLLGYTWSRGLGGNGNVTKSKAQTDLLADTDAVS